MTLILLNEPEAFPTTALRRLRKLAPVVTSEDSFAPSEVRAVFVRLAHIVDAAFLAQYPNLVFVVSPTTGLNHVDLSALAAANVTILSLNGCTDFLDTIHATAEHTLALALALIRKLPAAVQAVKQGEWNRYPFKGEELARKKVFILGYGRLGRQVHKLYAAFGCTVTAFDTLPSRVPASIAVPIEEGFEQADIISVHVNLTPSSAGLIGPKLLSKLKKSSLIINTSRGEVFDQEALFDQLSEGGIAGAALDVLCEEPDPLSLKVRSKIDSLGDRLIITPHISGFTNDSLERVEGFMVKQLEEVW